MDDELLNQHMADVKRFADIAQSLAATVLVVPYDNTVNASPSRVDQYRRFLERAAAFDVPVCSLLDAFDGRPIESLRVNSLDAHPNAEASKIAAARSVECILAKL
jgi:hypothetical protein